MRTLHQSVEALQNGENIVIFPEDSTKGYLEQLEDFHHGFLTLCEYCEKKGMDIPIFVTYFRKKDLVYFVDRPILYSELKSSCNSKEEMAKKLLNRCNELGQMQIDIPQGTTELFIKEQKIA